MRYRQRRILQYAGELVFFPAFILFIFLVLDKLGRIEKIITGEKVGPSLATYALGRVFTLLYSVDLRFKRYGQIRREQGQVRSFDLPQIDEQDFALFHFFVIILFLVCLGMWIVSVIAGSVEPAHTRISILAGTVGYLIILFLFGFLSFASKGDQRGN